MNKEINKILLLAFQIMLKDSQDMIFVKDRNLIYVAASASFLHMVGLDHETEIVGKSDYDIFDAELADKYTKDDRKIMDSGLDVLSYIELLPAQEGKQKYSSTSKYVICNEQGMVIGLFGIAKDVTAQMELEAERENCRLSREMFDSILEADLTENKMLRAEGGFLQQLHNLEGSSFTEMLQEMVMVYVHPDYREEILKCYDLETLKAGYEKGDREFCRIIFMFGSDCSYRWTELRVRVYYSRVSDTLRIITFMKNVNEEVCRSNLLEHRAVTDHLTGLSNREGVLNRITCCLEMERQGEQDALLFIDLDHFKQVNDSLGHQYGDKVLMQAAERLLKIHASDEICGRIGGDEFLVFLKDVKSKESVRRHAQQIVEALTFELVNEHLTLQVTCSIGITFCMEGNKSMEQLYMESDQAMYRAKEQGKNRICFYVDGMDSGE